jgi:hypothetical protein
VQFRCSKCGKTTIVELEPKPDQTQVITPLPSFARGEGAASPGSEIVSQYQGLSLPAGMVIKLEVVAGPSKGLAYAMNKPRVILGRAEADVELNDPEVSRWHCALEVKDQVIRLRDLDSTNGTYFNDERVRAAELKNFSQFRIGASVIRLLISPKPFA